MDHLECEYCEWGLWFHVGLLKALPHVTWIQWALSPHPMTWPWWLVSWKMRGWRFGGTDIIYIIYIHDILWIICGISNDIHTYNLDTVYMIYIYICIYTWLIYIGYSLLISFASIAEMNLFSGWAERLLGLVREASCWWTDHVMDHQTHHGSALPN